MKNKEKMKYVVNVWVIKWGGLMFLVNVMFQLYVARGRSEYWDGRVPFPIYLLLMLIMCASFGYMIGSYYWNKKNK